MRILACTLAIALLLAASAGAQTVSTKATLDACHTGAGTLERYAVFAAQMGTIRGAKKLQVRFDLLQRLPGGGFQPIAAPGLGAWRSSTADIFRYRKQVTGLQAPAAYRAVVLFRWVSPKGSILKSARRTTKTCTQPDPGADVAVGSIHARRAGSGRAQ